MKALKDSFICQISLDGTHIGLYPHSVRAKFVLEQLSFYFSDEQYAQRTYPRQYADARGFVRLRELSQSGRLRAMGASASVVAQAAAACPHTVLAPNAPPRIRKATAWERVGAALARLAAPPLDPIYSASSPGGGPDRPENFLREAAASNKHGAVPLPLVLSLPPLQLWEVTPRQAADAISSWNGTLQLHEPLPSVQPAESAAPAPTLSESAEDSRVISSALPLDVLSREGANEVKGGSIWAKCPVLLVHLPTGCVVGRDPPPPPLPSAGAPQAAWSDWGIKWDSTAVHTLAAGIVGAPSDLSAGGDAPPLDHPSANSAETQSSRAKDEEEIDEEFNAANLLTGAASVAQRMGLTHSQFGGGRGGGGGGDQATASAMAAVANLNYRGMVQGNMFMQGGSQFSHPMMGAGGTSAPLRAHSTPPSLNMMGGIDFSQMMRGNASMYTGSQMDGMGFLMPPQGGAGGFSAHQMPFAGAAMHFDHMAGSAMPRGDSVGGGSSHTWGGAPPGGTLQAALQVAQSPAGRALSALLTPLASLLRWLLCPAVLTTDDYLQRLALRVPKSHLTFVHATGSSRSNSVSSIQRQGTGVSTTSSVGGSHGWPDQSKGGGVLTLTPLQEAVPDRAVAWSIADLASHPQVEVALATSHAVAVALADSLGGPVSSVVASPVLLLQLAAGMLAADDEVGQGGDENNPPQPSTPWEVPQSVPARSQPVQALLALLEKSSVEGGGGTAAQVGGPSRQGSDESGTSSASTDSADIGSPLVLVLPGVFPPQRDWSPATNQLYAVSESDMQSWGGGRSSSPPPSGGLTDGGGWHLADGPPQAPVLGVPPHHPGIPSALSVTDSSRSAGASSGGDHRPELTAPRAASTSSSGPESPATRGGPQLQAGGALHAVLSVNVRSVDDASGASSVHSHRSAVSAASSATSSVRVTLTAGAVAALGGGSSAAVALKAAGAEHMQEHTGASGLSAFGDEVPLSGPAESNTTVVLETPSLIEAGGGRTDEGPPLRGPSARVTRYSLGSMPHMPPTAGVLSKSALPPGPTAHSSGRGGGGVVPPPRESAEGNSAVTAKTGPKTTRSILRRRATTLLRQDVAAHMQAHHGDERGDIFLGGVPKPASAGGIMLQRAQSVGATGAAVGGIVGNDIDAGGGGGGGESDDGRSMASGASSGAAQSIGEFAAALPRLLVGARGSGVPLSAVDAQESALSAATAGLADASWRGTRARSSGGGVSPAGALPPSGSLLAASSMGSFRTATDEGGAEWGLTPLAHGEGGLSDTDGAQQGATDDEAWESEGGALAMDEEGVRGGVGGLLQRCASGDSASLSDALRRAAVELQRGTTLNVAMASGTESASVSIGGASEASDTASFSQLVADSTRGLRTGAAGSSGQRGSFDLCADGTGFGLGLGLPSKDPLVLDSSAWGGGGAGLSIKAPPGFSAPDSVVGGGAVHPNAVPGTLQRNASSEVPLSVAAAALGTPSVTPRGGLWSGLGGVSLSDALSAPREAALSVAESVATPRTLHPPPRVVVMSKLPAPGRPAWDFSVLSWNILADCLALDGTETPAIAAEKAWQQRAPRIKHALLHYSADLLALQEVQCDINGPTDDVVPMQWPGVYTCDGPTSSGGGDGELQGKALGRAVSAASGAGSHRQWLHRCLTGAGYDVLFAPRWLAAAEGASAGAEPSRRSNFGNLLAWKKGTFSCLGTFMVHLGEAAQVVGSGVAAAMPKWAYPQVAPVALLRHAGTGCTLLATSVHVTANWRQPFTQLLQSMGLSCALCSLVSHTDAGSVCALGDFNSLPSAASYEWMVNASLLRSNAAVQQLAKLGVHMPSGGGSGNTGYGFSVPGHDVSGSVSGTAPSTVGHDVHDMVCGPSMPGLQFTSAYAQCLGHEPPCTNYVPHFEGCLDYQWTWRLLPVSVLRPLRDAGMRSAGHMPNALVPSDHVPLLSVMRFMQWEGQ